MPIIDNVNKKMAEALSNALETSDRVDICVGYFYFSGFKLLAQQLIDKKIRIIVGKELDPECIPDIVKYSRDRSVTLDSYCTRRPTTSEIKMRENYIDALVGFANDSDVLDSIENQDLFKIFISKLRDGSLEIRKTKEDYHGKFYLVYNKSQFSANGDFPGTHFMGSSNFTYSGLTGQMELNDVSRDADKFKELEKIFDEHWSSSKSIAIVDKNTSLDFIKMIKERVWIGHEPTPQEIYLRVLTEFYSSIENRNDISTPSAITNGLFFDLEYQYDAIKLGIDRINNIDGVIIADVVGIGKSIIASAIAHNLKLDTLIIAPPLLISQWEEYKVQFGILGPRVMSSGNMKAVYETYSYSSKPLLIIIDEAARFRNEDTDAYKMLHQICRCNPKNKILLITATPFNNSPKDIFALIKLFQTPGQSTIRSIDNLSMRFRDLIKRYTKLRRESRTLPKHELESELSFIEKEQRRFLEPVLIRRTRIDLQNITRYRKDLENQNIKFPDIVGPELLEYNLAETTDIYLETLDKISNPEGNHIFKGARYKPATYLTPEGSKNLIEKYGEGREGDLSTAHQNLADFMRVLLVRRFESSREAFRISLERMISNNIEILDWWNIKKVVPVMKKGALPDLDDFSQFDQEDGKDLEVQLQILRERKGLMEIPTSWIHSSFIEDVKTDIELLKGIHKKWFSKTLIQDPKITCIQQIIQKHLDDDPNRKIVIFSEYRDTVMYLFNQLEGLGIKRILFYTSSEASTLNRRIVSLNFDASRPKEKQEDEFSILICTDALSEGVNLNRAGAIINFDIPYNPTRVIQRIGRINRINKLMFPQIFIYNCFPTVVGEAETRIKSIATLKIRLINNVIGSDSRTLTPDEDLKSFFTDELATAQSKNEGQSWDVNHLEAYEKIRYDPPLMAKIKSIPRRTRIARRLGNVKSSGVVLFSKKGQSVIFTSSFGDRAEVLSAQNGLDIFEATENEIGIDNSDKFPSMFNAAKNKIMEKSPLPEITGRRSDAIKLLTLIASNTPYEAYCNDLIKIIGTYDDVSDGALKDISLCDPSDIEKCFEQVRLIIPESFIKNVLIKTDKTEDQVEIILLAEEFK